MTSPTREMDENRAELSDGFDDEPPPSGFEGSDDQDRSASGGGDYDSATSGEGARESDGDGRGPADGQGDEGRRRQIAGGLPPQQ